MSRSSFSAGYTYSFGAGLGDFYLIKTGSDEPPAVPLEQDKIIPKTFILHPPYPNPFNPKTTMEFAVPMAARVNLVVYDVMGRKVATLMDGWRDVGTYKSVFDGSGMASGIYFARMQTGDFHQVRKMVLLK